MSKRRTIIGVIGSGSDPHSDLSVPLGQWLGEQGYDLINGGGPGVMAAAAKAFAAVEERKGIAIGIIPSMNPREKPENRSGHAAPGGYPNPYIDLPIYTHLHLSGASGKETPSRNHIIILTADIVVALPGSAGTRSEIELALEYGKPLIIVNPAGQWDEFKNTSATTAKNIEEAICLIKNSTRSG